MKVVHVSTTIGNMGVDKVIDSISKEISANDGTCIWSYGRKRKNTKELDIKTHRIGNSIDVLIHALSSRVFDNSGLCSVGATKEFIEWLDEFTPDIVHLHSLLGYYINVEILFTYLAKKNIKVIWTQHDCWAFTGHCIHFENYDCYKWKSQCNNCPGIKSYPPSYGFDNSRKNYELKKRLFTSVKNLILVSPSRWLDNHIEESYLKNIPHYVIYNGIDLSVFSPRKSSLRNTFGISDDQILILGVSSIWTKSKGIETFRKLSTKLDSEKYRIVLVGSLPKEYSDVCDNIIHIDKLYNADELAKWYSEADLFVNPTEADNFPTVNIESLACGTPVITYKTGGSSEIISESTGIAVDSGDIVKLFEVINSIKERKSKEIINNCIERAQVFKKEKMVEEYIKLYDSLRSISDE